MAEISTSDTPTGTDAAAGFRILHTASSGEDTATSEFRFANTSENFDKHHPCPITIPQSHISTILEIKASPFEEKNATAGHSDHVTFGNNLISNQICKTTSGGDDVQNWESSTPSKYNPLIVDSTASANISGKGYIPGTSSEDNTASPNETVAVSEDIATVAGDPHAAPVSMATIKDNVAAASGISFVSMTVLGDTGSATNSEEAIPDDGDISNISSEGKIAGSADTFSAASTGDTAITTPSLGSALVFVDTNDTQAISSPDDCTTTADDITTAPRDFTADPVSDSGEISHITFKEASPSLPGDTTVLQQGGIAGVCPTDSSGIIPTFSASTEYITSDQSLPVITGSSKDFACSDSNTAVEGTHGTVGTSTTTTQGQGYAFTNSAGQVTVNCRSTTASEGLVGYKGTTTSFANRSKTDTISREADASGSAVPTMTFKDACKTSIDELNVSRNTTNTVSLEITKCPVTTDSGDTWVITGTNATAFGNINTTHLDTAIINESFLIIPGNVTNTADTRGTTTITPRNMITTPGKKPTASITHEDTSATYNAETSTILSCGNSMKAANLIEETTADSEDSTTKPDFVAVSGNSNAIECIAITGFVDNTAREDVIATTLENSDEMETPSSPQNVTIIIAGENPTTTLKRSSGCSITKASFGGSIASPVTVGTSTTTTQGQGYAFTNSAGQVTENYRSTTASEGLVGDKGTTTGFGGSAIPGNDTGMIHRQNNSSIFYYASITSASEETCIVSQNTTVNIANTISSQNASEQSTKTQVGQYSETITRKTSTVFGSSTNIHRDMDTIEVTLSDSSNTVTTTAAKTSTTTVLENSNTATSRRPTPTSQNINDMISEEVTASPMSEGKPIREFTGICGDTLNEKVSPDSASANNTVQDGELTVADDSKTPSDTTMVIPGDITSVTNISLLSRELNTSVLEDAANNKPDSASINAMSSGDISEDAHYEGRITPGHSETETVIGCVSIPDSSFSIRTNFQEASEGPRDTTTLLGYTTNILESAQIGHEFASVHSKISTVLVQTPQFNDTITIWGGSVSTEATRQSESAPAANAASPSVDNKIQSETLNTPVTTGTRNIISHKGTESLSKSLIPDSISTSVISGIFEATPVPKERRNTTDILDASSAFSAGDVAIITTTKSKGAAAPRGSGDFMKTTTLLKDTTTFTTTSTGATATVTALKDTVMTTQTSMRDIATVSRNKTTTVLEDTSTLRETVTSEKMAAATLGNITARREVFIPVTRSCAEISVSNINPKEILSNDPSDRITADSLAATNIINTLSDTISTPNYASSLLEITTSPEGILASRNNCTTTHVQISIQSQTAVPEVPSTVTETASFATEENTTVITTREAGIAHPVPEDATPENENNSSVTINNSENFTNITAPSVSPREVVAATCIPLDTTSSAVGQTVASGQRFFSRNDANASTALKEVCARPDYPSPTEAFSTLAHTSLSDTRHLVELVTPCLSTISISESTSKISEASTSFGNAITPILFLQGTDQSITTEDTTNSVATTGIAAFADPKSITIAPGDMHTLVRTTLDESGQSVANSTPEYKSTTFGAPVTYTGGKTTGTDVDKYMITTTIVSEETITAFGENISDLPIPRDKNPVTADASIHARTSIAHEEAISVDGDTTSGPTTSKSDASLIPTCIPMISPRETLIPSATTASKDTDILATTAVVARSPTTATTVASGKHPTLEVTMVMEKTAASGIITTAEKTFVPKITTSVTETLISRSATEVPLVSSSEAIIFPAETSTDGATFSSGQTAAFRNVSSVKNTDDEDLAVVTTGSSTSSSVNIPFTSFNTSRKTLIFEDDACNASGHPYVPENKDFTPKNVATTVPEDTTIVSGNTSKVSEGPVVITCDKDIDSPAKETPTTIEGATVTPRDTTDTTTTEFSVTTPTRTIVVSGETPTISPGEKTTAIYTTTETAKVPGETSDKTGMILTTTPRESSIATFEKAMDSTTREIFVAPGETLITSHRKTFATTSGKITGTSCTSTSQRSDISHEDASAIPEETITGILRETATVELGRTTETTPRETTTIIHRKISTAVPQKTFTIASSGASPASAPVTSLPYWSITLIGMTVIVFLLAGFCMVIYYVTVFILVAYSASLSSNTFS
ncbi:UNVERIFIED_CONTAM: hypothetical protein K2H54_060013 [Gekko kuhli]